jgi:hypothetical protein
MRKLFLLLVLSQVGATDCGQVIRDAGFDLWCGEELCAWKVTRGAVKEIPTWNQGDKGVELVGTDVAIQQLSPVSSRDGTCIHFHLIANVEDNAEVFLNIDVEGDGTVERSERLPASRWKPLSYNLAIAAPYDGIRFEITKAGVGTGALANIGAELTDAADCAGLTPLDPGPRRNGAFCTAHEQCGSGLCSAFVCAGCDATHACTGGTVCGAGEPFSPVFEIPTECVPAADKLLGEHCIIDGECASNACSDGACVRCKNGCALAASGQPCGDNYDCASGVCTGPEQMQCYDGRACSSPAQCPYIEGLKNGACTTVGIEGGVCQ